MRFKGLDLNLLVALDTLIELQSISRTAERLHLSQPGMSAALGRLRDYFQDPILVAHGKRMIPTPYALQLRQRLRALLVGIDEMITASTTFDPAVSQRRFRIGVSDYLATVLFSRLLPRLQEEAPHIGFDLVPPSDALVTSLEQGELDLIITLDENLSLDHPSRLVFEERHVVVGWRENPVMAAPMTAEAFFASGHVAVSIGRQRPTSFAETHLRQLGHERRIELRVSYFSLVPEMLIGSRRLAIMHERLARHFAKTLPITIAEMPFDFPVMRESIQSHSTRENDVGLQWLIPKIIAEGQARDL